jgi:ankyrin repeat protein
MLELVSEDKIKDLRNNLKKSDDLEEQLSIIYPKIIRTNNVEMMEMIITEFNFNVKINENDPIIKCSTVMNNGSMLKLLIKHGAEIEILGETPKNINILLYNSCLNNNIPAAKILLELGLKANMCNGHLLIISCKYGTIELVKLLIEFGANMNCQNGMALVEAAKFGKGDIVELLLELGVQVDIFKTIKPGRDKYDKTFNLLVGKGVNPLVLLKLFITR